MYLSLGSPENRPRTKGLRALMLSRSIFYTTECRWGTRGEGRNKRELFEVLSVIIVWSQWNRLPGGHINDCLLGLSTGGAWWRIYPLSPFFLDQILLYGTLIPYELHLCGCQWVPQCLMSLGQPWSPGGGENGRHRCEIKFWWMVTPWSWPESMQSGPLIARLRVLVTGEAWEDLKGWKRCWKTCLIPMLTTYQIPHCIPCWAIRSTEVSE